MRLSYPLALAAIALTASLTACDGGTPAITVTTTPTASPSASASPSTPPPPPPPADEFTFGDQWTLESADGARGSGCNPGTGLPDGVWYGDVSAWSTSTITFDMVCLWTDADLIEANPLCTADDLELGWCETNTNTLLRHPTVDGNIPAQKADMMADDEYTTLSEVIADPGGSLPVDYPYPVWIFVNGGVVTELAVQYWS